MTDDLLNLAARDHLVGIWPMVVGVAVVALLLTAFWYGRQRRLREPPPPVEPQPRAGAWQTREEYGRSTSPDHGPGHQDGDADRVGYESTTEPHPEMPKDGHRYLPQEIAAMPSTGDGRETSRRTGPSSGNSAAGTPRDPRNPGRP
ncbi:DUF6479 family protein [Streptomyces sp. NPDC059637]|uniref:DUF6479 family protein n=1 Tax=Streptomyces sp. NPDC059637 TaxID=3347752 RepID=UPI0036D03F4D